MKLADLAKDPLALVKERQEQAELQMRINAWEHEQFKAAAKSLATQLMERLASRDLETVQVIVVRQRGRSVCASFSVASTECSYELSALSEQPPHAYKANILASVCPLLRAELSTELSKVLTPLQYRVVYDVSQPSHLTLTFPDPKQTA